jgi:putative transcriptional regulator
MSRKEGFCPDTEMLVEFSAGALGAAESICVSAHLHFCSKCRETLLQLDQLGSKLLADSEAEKSEANSFDEVMEKIESLGDPEKEDVPLHEVHFAPVVDRLMKFNPKSLKWKRLSSSVDTARLETGQDKFEVSLHKICAGGKAPVHDHQGLEYTVVLKGSFSDERSVYREGDFILREPGQPHQPIGAQNGECICLSAQSAPIKLKGPFGFIMNRWLQIHPR